MLKKYFRGKKAAFFDLDGSLIDSESMWRRAFLIILHSLSPAYSAILLSEPEEYSGMSVCDKWEKLIEKGGIETNFTIKELSEKTKIEFLKLAEEGIDVRDGFWELAYELKGQKGYKLALVTNTDRDVADTVLASLKITSKTFDFVICGDEVEKVKPNPEIYKKAIKAAGLKPSQIICFEDSVSGAKAARAAKLDVVVIWNGAVGKDRYPKGIDLFVPDFSDFPGHLDTTFVEEIEKAAGMTKENEKKEEPAKLEG